MPRTLSRKELLTLGAATGGTLLVGGCDLFATDPSEGTGAGPGRTGRQAPMLARQVEAGDLPPLKQRLPDRPRVIQPVEQLGSYGGTWQHALIGTDVNSIIGTWKYDPLVMWDRNWEQVVPNVAEQVEISGGGREYLFGLRQGMKWSDGEPLTADDIMFWYEAVFKNKELTPVIPTFLQFGGVPVVAEKVDDYTVRFSFTKPYALFLQQLADWDPIVELLPSHYLKEFHKDFNPEIDALVKKNNLSTWVDLWYQQTDIYNNTELPTHRGWQLATPLSSGKRVVYDRNPYYFAVDPEGRQLPYIDRIIFDIFNEDEVLILRAANGDIGMYHHDPIANPRNRPVLAKSAEKGGYKLWDMRETKMNTMGICLNLTHPDPAKRRMYQNKDFRIGLSYAINRQEIIDTVYQRQGRPWQTAPRPEVPFYDSDDIGTQYTEYDLDRANEHLDRAGYTDRASDGRRLGSDGKPISITVLTDVRYFEMADVLELMKKTWATVGIELRIDNLDTSLYGPRKEAGDYDCTTDIGEYGYKGMVLDPRWLFATAGSSYAPLWSNWYEGADPSEEPPEPMKRQVAIYHDEVEGSLELETRYEGMRTIIEIARDEFWTMGISLPAKPVVLVRNDFHNVQKDMWYSTSWPTPGPSNICQYFIAEE
ncbi:ABC transporter substrate-binding protein [Actinopolymorpha sp. B11F2]|uniref:ABC transporter substrate-binding protein n=1 Tax=Actinopolymorpha sp. B11F2 TaxID=3160862 RepID=UPI0032E37765